MQRVGIFRKLLGRIIETKVSYRRQCLETQLSRGKVDHQENGNKNFSDFLKRV